MKIKAGNKTYSLDGELSLGEFRMLKRHFDMPTMDALNPADPDHILGLLYVAARRENPALTIEDFERFAETITRLEVEDEPDPQPAGSSDSSPESQTPASDAAPASAASS